MILFYNIYDDNNDDDNWFSWSIGELRLIRIDEILTFHAWDLTFILGEDVIFILY